MAKPYIKRLCVTKATQYNCYSTCACIVACTCTIWYFWHNYDKVYILSKYNCGHWVNNNLLNTSSTNNESLESSINSCMHAAAGSHLMITISLWDSWKILWGFKCCNNLTCLNACATSERRVKKNGQLLIIITLPYLFLNQFNAPLCI